MAGAGGQTTMIVPSHDLVVVRLGHYKGEAAGTVAFRKALKLLLEAVPLRRAELHATPREDPPSGTRSRASVTARPNASHCGGAATMS